MKDRSYQQFCALAFALDAIGERWTLLTIRELLAGPRRFKDLVEGIAGH
jgi:DNA-binding HxlR family transcriptional regulator